MPRAIVHPCLGVYFQMHSRGADFLGDRVVSQQFMNLCLPSHAFKTSEIKTKGRELYSSPIALEMSFFFVFQVISHDVREETDFLDYRLPPPTVQGLFPIFAVVSNIKQFQVKSPQGIYSVAE